MDRPDEPKQRVPGPRSLAEPRFSGTAARPRAHAAAARLAPVARHAGGTRTARPRTRGGDRHPAAVTYEAIADRKIGHAALRPEICSGIVGWRQPCARTSVVLVAAPIRCARRMRLEGAAGRGGRVVDRAALEMRSARKRTGGSNPSL